MVARTMWLTLVAVGVMAVSGLGFAAFTATATSSITGTGGNLALSWSSPSTTTSAGYVSCPVSVSGPGDNALTASAAPLAPGDWCDVQATITNTGNVPASVSVSYTSSGATGCVEYVDWTTYPTTIAPGGTISYEAAIELQDGADNTCMNEVATVTTTISASASTGETGEPNGGASSAL